MSFAELERRANRLAHYLTRKGVRSGDRIGLLLNRSAWSYAAMLAVSKVGAAWVPLDRAFPRERVGFILKDAEIRLVLSVSSFATGLGQLEVETLCLDRACQAISAESDAPVMPPETAEDALCYIIYTSGSTGQPKGVAVNHSSICNFIRVAAEVYGLSPRARVYQGLTFAFDFSFEEIWVPLYLGATLVPAPDEGTLLGADLARFLVERQVTALVCVPTLLATLEEDLPDLDFVLVSGEACPANLIERWCRKGRTFLNVYGPTETTVTATLARPRPGGPVTIGRPLPTYSVVILDTEADRIRPRGEIGEIAIAGVGVAEGYVNRPDKTEQAFRPDFIGIDHNPGGRLYRTGDLGRITSEGEVEYLGRIDTQVKIRGYRIDLAEVETVLMEVPGILQAVANVIETAPGVSELAAYYTLRHDADGPSPKDIHAAIRPRLPSYMLPAFLEELSEIPMLPSQKADRKSLPPPRHPRHAACRTTCVAPRNDEEAALAGILADVLGVDQVSVEADFFEDLGANSLLMARFCAAVRSNLGLTAISMRDVYLNPTVRKFAPLARAAHSQVKLESPPRDIHLASNRAFVTCGVLQGLVIVAAASLAAFVAIEVLLWVALSPGRLVALQRSTLAALAIFAGSAILPIAIKWTVIGRFRPGRVPIWSFAYFRYWVVRSAIRLNPLVLFAGTPVYNVYLRLLGASIAPQAVIGCRMPAATDLFTVGQGAVIRNSAIINCYRARSGFIEFGPTTIGANSYVGNAAVLDIDSGLGDRAQLGHVSSLQQGQFVPAGKRFHGSPAEETATNFCTVPPRACGALRRILYPAVLAILVIAGASLSIFAFEYLISWMLLDLTAPAFVEISWELYRMAALLSSLLLLGLLMLGLLLLYGLPRLLAFTIRDGEVYPLFGLHHFIFQTIGSVSNSAYFNGMLGDSSFIVGFLKFVGYRLDPVVQTGSNFGLSQVHEMPFMCRIGSGTMISDGLSMVNSENSHSSLRLSAVSIGDRNFVGNNVAVLQDAKVGENCLLATKVMVPIDGPLRENTGLLGSPSFEIPRSVMRDRCKDRYQDPDVLGERLRLKNRSNAAAIALLLLAQAVTLFLMLGVLAKTFIFYEHHGILVLPVAVIVMSAILVGYSVLMERASIGFERLEPQSCSIYDNYYWTHERYWKFSFTNQKPFMGLFNGTPFKSTIFRLLGVRVGRRLFDDGCWISEKSMTEIGDDCTLAGLSTLQGHSLEDGVFKSGRIRIGDRCSIGSNAFVHYDVEIGDDVEVYPDSFVMKGENLPSGTHWLGNPARQIL
ncbi:Pls/PosA family non-ribosomal peptide synthetase [Paracoccus benzoatiresistens]|uniref:Amino acid adenylation domain-containing protein n=1 Tax=Paracoccus benzoatiresistens TaxID=2997341 RepID=A0ABT4JBM4_9RHOB|nr:Pls/PosA family non-ribosomal peptide synthetase [Paracoccus sp. EF6]MCZ0964299.1 amino acid adenylation domain-containing protein [Paracoccus sp. EF6]